MEMEDANLEVHGPWMFSFHVTSAAGEVNVQEEDHEAHQGEVCSASMESQSKTEALCEVCELQSHYAHPVPGATCLTCSMFKTLFRFQMPLQFLELIPDK